MTIMKFYKLHFFWTKPGSINLILWFLFAFFLFIQDGWSQAKKIPPSELILKDTINLGDSSRSGIINKVIQPFRFRENIQKRERERIVALIRRLTTEGDISIDSSTVQSITDELVELTNYLMITRDTTIRLQEEIARTIQNLDSKAPRSLVDSIQVQLGNVLQGLLDQSNSNMVSEKSKLNASLTMLRQIGLSCGASALPILRDTVGDTLIVDYQICLKPKIPVFGIHTSVFNKEFQGYNLNYLSDLVLKGYQIGADGLEANPKELKNVLDSAVLAKSKSFGLRISLSVSTGSSDRTRSILTNEGIQTRFVNRVTDLVKSARLGGVNLDFSGLNNQDIKPLYALIKRLKQTLTSVDPSLIISLNLPPLANKAETAFVSLLDFEELNKLLDYYLIQTQRLNITATRIPFSLSPLLSDETNSRGSIENALAFYSNKGAPPKKLVITVSYEGIFWPMPDYIPGTRAQGFGKIIDYPQSQELLVSSLESENSGIVGFDPLQASAYLNFSKSGDLFQLWFTEPRGLAAKYEWAIKNSLGGIAVQGLGSDAGTSALWDVLGATLMQVDTVILKSQKIEPIPPKESFSFLDYIFTYSRDIQFAGLNDIYIGNPNREPKELYCYYDPYPDREEIKNLAQEKGIRNYWDFVSEFKKYPNTDHHFIKSQEECICLLGRWDIYTEINGISFLVSFALLIITVIITFLGIKRNGDDWNLRGTFIGLNITFGLLSFITFFFYLFFNTQFRYIGAGSDEVTIWGLIIIFSIGIIVGVIIHRLRISKTFTQRDLP